MLFLEAYTVLDRFSVGCCNYIIKHVSFTVHSDILKLLCVHGLSRAVTEYEKKSVLALVASVHSASVHFPQVSHTLSQVCFLPELGLQAANKPKNTMSDNITVKSLNFLIMYPPF